MKFLIDNWPQISAILVLALKLAQSEYYSLNPALKYNGVIQKWQMERETLKQLRISLVPEDTGKK